MSKLSLGKWHVLKQYIKGTFLDGKPFCVKITTRLIEKVLIDVAEKKLGKKVKKVYIILK